MHSHPNLYNLELGTLPGQFAGGLNNAEVVLLALNPGYDKRDEVVDLQLPEFVDANCNNHIDPYSSQFYYFDGGLDQTAGYEWWARILKPLLQAGITEATLRQKIMLIEYFPYHSVSDPKIKTRIPSQQFAFDLVREAITRGKTIVVMRALPLWLAAVHELAGYPYMKVRSWRNPTISPNNLGEANFNTIKAKLT